MSRRIVRREILQQGQVLRLWFDDESVADIDLLEESKRGPAYAPLADPEYVKGVRRVWGGHLLQWPDGVTWSADVLWESAAKASVTRKAG